MLERLADGVYGWTASVPSRSRPDVTHAFTGFALVLPARSGVGRVGRVVLVDPPALTEAQCAQLERLGTPTHVLLTCEWHTRRAAWCRDRWRCAVLMHPVGAARAEIAIDGVLEGGALLWGTVRVVHVPDVYYPEEVALCVEYLRPAPFLIVGDALSGGREEQGIPVGEVALHAPRYVADFAKAHASLRRLLAFRFDGIGFGHGAPIPVGGRAAVERCLESELAWLATGGRQGTLDRLAGWRPPLLVDRYRGAAEERMRGVPALPYD